MIEVARRRLSSTAVRELVDFRVLAIEDIGVLRDESPFDGAFSNFSGLNCVDDLPAAARSLARLLKHGARVLLCMSGRFVPMEIAWYLAHGSPRKAMRRIARSGARHPTDDPRVHVHYPSVRVIARAFAPEFRLLGWKGIGVVKYDDGRGGVIIDKLAADPAGFSNAADFCRHELALVRGRRNLS